MLPWQPQLSLGCTCWSFKANIHVYAISFIVMFATVHFIYQTLDLSFGCCITALGFISGCYTARAVLNFGGSDKSDKTINITHNYRGMSNGATDSQQSTMATKVTIFIPG